MTQPIQLPDCSARRHEAVLSPGQRRELIRILATQGQEGVDAWIEQAAEQDPRIAEAVASERERLERQARRERRRIEAASEEGRERTQERWSDQIEALDERERALHDELEDLEGRSQARPEELAERSALFRMAVDPGEDDQAAPGWWTRVKAWLYRVYLGLIEAWVRLLRWLRGEREPPEPQSTIELPEGARLALPDLLATRPGLRIEVRRRIREELGMRERVRRWWRRLAGREDYAQLARELMADELRAARDEVHRDRRERKQALSEQLDEVEEELTATRRERNEELRELAERRERDLEALEAEIEQGPIQHVAESIFEEMVEAGLVSGDGTPTEHLLHRLSNLLYEDVRRALPSQGNVQPGAFLGGEGEYEKHPLRSLNERGSMDIASSVVRARQNHPTVNHLYDSDLLVHREIRASSTHVVLILDRSGSMEERGRFEAAKRVALVMYRAVKDHDPRHRVDILTMSTGVERVDLEGCWNAELGGFTNFQAALRMAGKLIELEAADRRLVYLVTDGLPEAYVGPDGDNLVEAPEVCMEHTKREAAELANTAGARLMIIQLEDEDELYIEAAREIAEAADGRVEALDPTHLAEQVLLDFEAETGLD